MWLIVVLVIIIVGVILYQLATWPESPLVNKDIPDQKPVAVIQDIDYSLIEPQSFVASEARVVPSKASYSNKFNDVIGNFDSGLAPGAIGVPEIVIPSDWYMFRTPPTEFDGPYWPSGSIKPDFIYPGGNRPLRSQNLYASQIVKS